MPTDNITIRRRTPQERHENSQQQRGNEMIQRNQTIYFRLKLLSPLHVGCDEVYEPTSFVIDEKNNELISFNPFEFLAKINENDRREFSTICKKGTIPSLLEIYKFIKQHADQSEGERVAVSSALAEHYKQTLSLSTGNAKTIQQELNNFLINRTAFSPLTNLPYVPGSSIKGSIRTAVLNLRNNGGSTPPFLGKEANRKLQEYLLFFQFDKLETDPFRMIKVSDFLPVMGAKRRIVYALDRKKKLSDREAQAPYQILEIVEQGAEFIGAVSITRPGAKAGIKKPVEMDELLNALHIFYQAEKAREDSELSSIGVTTEPLSIETGSEHPIRIGRHSGAECVTIKGRRKISIMQGRGNPPKELDRATTIWLAADSKKSTNNNALSPFGWAILKKITEEEWHGLMMQSEELIEKRLHHLQERVEHETKKREMLQARLDAEQAEQTKKEMEDKKRHKELNALQTRWGKMSEEECDLACIRKDDLAIRFAASEANDPISNIWKKIDTASPEHQKALAQAFKERWQSEGKWAKKECSKKQYDKVQKVKKILDIS